MFGVRVRGGFSFLRLEEDIFAVADDDDGVFVFVFC